MLHVTEATREQSIRALVSIFYGKAVAHASESVSLIFVQQCSAKPGIRHFEVQGPVVQKVWARGAGDRKIAVPVGSVENTQAMVTWEQDGKPQAQPAFKVFDWNLPFDCALVANIDPTDRPLTSISSMSSGSSNIAARTVARWRMPMPSSETHLVSEPLPEWLLSYPLRSTLTIR